MPSTIRRSRIASTLVPAALLAMGLVHCNLAWLPSSQTQSTSQTPLPLQPQSAWTQNGGTINPACTPTPNPRETGFVDLGTGVELSAASDRVDCCTCTARSRAFSTATTPVAGTHLQGTMAASRGSTDTYSIASMRITLKSGGSTVGSRLLQQESRANNNCAGSSELPATIVGASFDLDVASFVTGAASFDEVDVDLMGYACGDASSEITLQDLAIATMASSTSPAPSGTGSNPNPNPNPNPTPTPASVGFFQTSCENPANPMVEVDSGICPNGPDLRTKTTVTCMVTGPNNTVTKVAGALTAVGQVARADCSGIKPACDSLQASGFPNPQVIINDRVSCL